jgi:hypothetical protein
VKALAASGKGNIVDADRCEGDARLARVGLVVVIGPAPSAGSGERWRRRSGGASRSSPERVRRERFVFGVGVVGGAVPQRTPRVKALASSGRCAHRRVHVHHAGHDRLVHVVPVAPAPPPPPGLLTASERCLMADSSAAC